MPLTETLQDDFTSTTIDTVKWPNNFGAVTQPAGRARIPCTTGFAGYSSATIYTLAGSSVWANMFPPAAAGATLESWVELQVTSTTAGTDVIFEINTATGLIRMANRVSFSDADQITLPYDAGLHAWLRIREESGTLYWDTSPDAMTWTNQRSTTSPAWVSATDLAMQVVAHRDAGSSNVAEFDDFNIPAADGYIVTVDWNNDGIGTGAGENVTEDVLQRAPVTFQYGRDDSRALSPPRVGTIGFTLCNADRVYSPENPDSPISSDVAPAARINVGEVIDGTLYPLMTGRIDTFRANSRRADRSVEITGFDDLAFLRGKKISTGLYEAQRTGALIGVILDAVGWTAGRDLDVGATFVPWWWASSDDAFDLLTQILRSEGTPSIAYIAPDGTFTYRDRHHRLLRTASLASQALFAAGGAACDSPPVTGFSYLDNFEYEIGWRDIVNDVQLPVVERVPQADLSTVWESDDTISLSIGEARQIRIETSDPFRDAQDISSTLGDIVYSGAGVPIITLARTSGQSTTATITAAGASLTVTYLRLRARSVPVARTIQIAMSDSTSITRHGDRTYQEDVPWAGQHDVFAVAQLLLAQYAERRPTVKLGIVSSDLADHLEVVTRQISDLITIRNSELGLDSDFFIENVQHTLTRMVSAETCPGPVHYATFGCEQSGIVVADNPFTFDKTGAGFDDGAFDATGADNPATVWIWDAQSKFDTHALGT